MKKRTRTALILTALLEAALCVTQPVQAVVQINVSETVLPQERSARPAYSGVAFSVPELKRSIGGDGMEVLPMAQFMPVRSVSADSSVFPSKYDMREHGAITSVKNQSGHGTCWAHSSAAAAETDIVGRMPQVDLSELHTAYYSYAGFGQIEPPSDDLDKLLDNGGNSSTVVNLWSQWIGPEFESVMPYHSLSSLRDAESEVSAKNSGVFHLENAMILEYNKERTNFNEVNSLIKESVMNGNGVDVTFCTNSEKYFNSAYACSYSRKKPRFANHAVVIAGWDDDYPAGNFRIRPEGNGAWLAKNSWGSDYGKDGYMWISYYDMSLGEFTTYDMGDKDNYDYNYQVDSYVPVQTLAAAEDEAELVDGMPSYMANIFKNGNASQIEAVSTYFMNSSTDYEVTVYSDLKDPTDPVSGTPSSVTTGHSDLTGYFTIDLDEPVPVSKDNYFSVVVKISSPVTAFVVPLETVLIAEDHDTGKVTSIGSYTTYEGICRYTGENESFFSSDGVDWSSSTEGNYRYTDDEKEDVLEDFKKQLYDGIEEEDVEEKEQADKLIQYYTDLFAVSDISIIMGNISLKAFANDQDTVSFSHPSGAVPLNEMVELVSSGADKILYIINEGEAKEYTSPIAIEGESRISAYTDKNPTVNARDYHPATAEFFSLGYDTTPAFYSPVLKYAERINAGLYHIDLSIAFDKVRFFPVSDCEIEFNGKKIENYKVTEQFEVPLGQTVFEFKLKKENALDNTVKVVVDRSPVEFDMESETVKVSGTAEIYAPDGTRLITGSDAGKYAGQKLTVKDNDNEFELDVPKRAEIPDSVLDYSEEALIFDGNESGDAIEMKNGGIASSAEYQSAACRLYTHTGDGKEGGHTAFSVIPGETVCIRMKATDTMFASEAKEYVIPSAPAGFEAVPEHTIKNGKVIFKDGNTECYIPEETDVSRFRELVGKFGFTDNEQEFRKLMTGRFGISEEKDLMAAVENCYYNEKATPSVGQRFIIRKAPAEKQFASKVVFVTVNEYEMGDADGNGIVDGRDATLVLTHYAKLSTGGNGIIRDDMLPYCDMDGNDIIDGRDASAILTIYAKSSVIN